jgi:alkanesulfonate monooxygenase SsuD/methylene tetrahydromethanopterin reductase-like flavin-dependent oxidoreductase (luciferase family)
VQRFGFLSFGHWRAAPGSQVRTAADALLQTVELAVAAEELGAGGAFVRVHHFARQLASPLPLLTAMAMRTSRIEPGTGVIDMRYENPLYLAEEAAAADLLSGGRLQLGVSRGSPETVVNGYELFGYAPAEGHTATEDARAKTGLFLRAIEGVGLAQSDPRMGPVGLGRAEQWAGGARVPIQPQSPGLRQRIWWGAGTRETARWAAEQGLNLMSSTLLTEDTGVPLSELQAEQIRVFRTAWADAGWSWSPRVSVSRSVVPITTDEDRAYFGDGGEESQDQIGRIEGAVARFGRSYIGEPDVVAAELAGDEAVRLADTLLITVPNMLGVAYNTHLLESFAKHVAPALTHDPTG